MTKYHVTLISKHQEEHILETESKEKAIERAQNETYYIDRDCRKNESVEIRVYTDDSFCDYDTIEF